MTRKVTCFLIDGGYMRVCMAASDIDQYDPDIIYTNILKSVRSSSEQLHRIFFYDGTAYRGKITTPIGGEEIVFDQSDEWLSKLGEKPYVALRRGYTTFRGWRLKGYKRAARGEQLEDRDFSPIIMQKGVDMRIGIDIANLAAQGKVDRLILASADNDMIPAIKHARIRGLQVGILRFERPTASPLNQELKEHADFVREVKLSSVAARLPLIDE